MNEQSLQRVNAFLAEVATRVRPGESFDASPGDIARAAGFDDHLAAARAVRALIARKRLEMVDGRYRLLDAKPVAADEQESIPRPPRRTKRKAGVSSTSGRRAGVSGDSGQGLTYSDVGAAAVDRLIELGREVGNLNSSTRSGKEELRDLRQERDEAVRRATSFSERAKDLEGRLEMAEMNLRTLLAAARGTVQAEDEGPVGDSEMEAILGVLKTGEDAGAGPTRAAQPGPGGVS